MVIECDIPDWQVWVYYDGKPLMINDDSDRQVCKWLGDDMELNKGHLYNFINKFVNDEDYRNDYINGIRHYR